MSLLESKSLLAKLMATEDLSIQQSNVQTASFNIETRVLTVPILDRNLSKELYDLFMGHEVGHALWTPLEGMKKAIQDKINMSVINVVEDSRIERKIKNKYPGIRAPFVKAYSELFERNFFGTEGKDVNKYNLIDRINLHCKIGASLALPFTPEERELLDAVEMTETYEEVVEVTKRICDFMKLQAEEELKQIKIAAKAKGSGDKSKKSDKKENGEGEEEDDLVAVDASGEETEEETEIDPNQDPIGSPGASRNEDFKDEIPEIRSHTDDAYKMNENQLFSKENDEYLYVNIPFYDVKKGIFDYKEVYRRYESEGCHIPRETFIAYRKESAKVVSYLVKEFELRKNADQMKRAATSKTGDLNMSKIYSYGFNEDLFKKITVVPQGKSHGLIMFLDWSGSMAQHIGNTVKQLLNLVLFCKKVNIPYEVYSFIEHTDQDYMYKPKAKCGDLYVGAFGLVNLLSSRMSPSDFTTAAAALMNMAGLHRTEDFQKRRIPTFLRMSGTPLNECVIAAMELVPHFQKTNRIQIVNTVFLTDGEGSCLHDMYKTEYYPHKLPFTHMVIRDPKTRHEEIYDKKKYRWFSHTMMHQTDCLIRLLKKRTNSHVIGFFVCNTKDVDSRFNFFCPEANNSYSAKENFKDEFKSKRYVVVTSTGYDDYYLLRSNGLDTDDDELSFNPNATTRGMVTAFSKYTGNKITSRVVLNRFIKLIA